MQSVIDVKLKKLKKWFSLRDNVIVAYSGGVDSSLLAQVAYSTLGSKAIAITADSPSIARKDLADAKELARSIGIQHIVVNTFEINNPDYFTNPENRCYFCKEELFRTIKNLAKQHGIKTIVDGTNNDDLSDYRPGTKAGDLFEIERPFVELEIGKEEIREISRSFNLPTADKPSSPCLSSRIVHGEVITLEKLNRIEKAENFIKQISGIQVLRLRDHGDIARIEVGINERNLLLNEKLLDMVDDELKNMGFKYVTFELSGYTSGSINGNSLLN